MTAITICSDFGTPKNKVCHCFHCLPIYSSWSDGTKCHDLSFLNVEFKPTFHSPLSLASRSSLVLLRFLPYGGMICISSIQSLSCIWGGIICIFEVIDISPGNLDSSLCFLHPRISHNVLCYKLNKQGDNIQPWRTLFPIWNQSFVPCPILTVASWPTCRFLKRQVRWSGIPISWRIFHRLLWSTQSKALA